MNITPGPYSIKMRKNRFYAVISWIVSMKKINPVLFRECYQFRVLHSVKQAPSLIRKVWTVKKFVKVKRSSLSKVYNTINCDNRLKVTDLLALKSPKVTQEQFLKTFFIYIINVVKG